MTPQVSSSLITGGSTLAGSLLNAATSSYWASKNLDFQKRQFDYQRQLNELQMRREDSALQRGVADARAAGLSPLSATGAVTGDLSSTSFSGVGNNAGQVDVAGAVNSALKVYATLKDDKRADETTNANVLLAGAQAANAQAEAEKNNQQAIAFEFQNGINAATRQAQVDRFDLANQMLSAQINNIWSNTNLNRQEKEYRAAQLEELQIKLESYSDYLKESLNNMKIQNQNQTIQGDILRLDRLFKNYDWSVSKMDKAIDWQSKNKSLFGMLIGDLTNMTAAFQNAFTKPQTDWFHEYGK